MTGFAQTVLQDEGFVLTVTLRSVNHRSLDLHLNLPEVLQAFEPAIRKEITARHPRGHLQLRVTLEREAGDALAVNEDLIANYVALFRRVEERFGLPQGAGMTTLAQLPGVIAVTGAHRAMPISPQLEAAFRNALRETVSGWDQMREKEGMILAQDLRTRGLEICSSIERLERHREEMVPLAQQKLRERLEKWLGQSGIDPSRLAQEAAMIAERTDVSEEILRLQAHLAQFLELLDGNSDIGKKLDFLLQEIQRELNTLTAKTAGLGVSSLPMTEVALGIKGEVEKLREQVQNLQ